MRQKFGQNFLVDASIARRIVESAELSREDRVLEIGPGKAVLTDLIAPQVKELTAVEIDRDLAAQVAAKFQDRPNVRIINDDFLRFSLADLQGPLKVLGNLPYNVSTAIIDKFLPEGFWTTAVVMVQKEVGERIHAAPDTQAYGSFSLLCQYFARVSLVAHVPPGAFSPRPQVDSVVLRLDNLNPPPVDPLFFPFVRSAFQHRRKTILNSLSFAYDLPRETIAAALKDAGIDPGKRPQNLRLGDYELLFQRLPRPEKTE